MFSAQREGRKSPLSQTCGAFGKLFYTNGSPWLKLLRMASFGARQCNDVLSTLLMSSGKLSRHVVLEALLLGEQGGAIGD